MFLCAQLERLSGNVKTLRDMSINKIDHACAQLLAVSYCIMALCYFARVDPGFVFMPIQLELNRRASRLTSYVELLEMMQPDIERPVSIVIASPRLFRNQ